MDNILVKDDTITTPVEYILNPVSDTPAPFWRASVAGVPLDGQIRLTLVGSEQQKSGVKMSVKLEVPVMETLGASGASTGYVAPPKVAHVVTGIFTMFSSTRATNQNRADTMKMLIGILQGASATTATGILANTAAGNAFVNSTLPITQAFTKLIRPS
jgi:hypothetical protein